jgi:hypothetical protein
MTRGGERCADDNRCTAIMLAPRPGAGGGYRATGRRHSAACAGPPRDEPGRVGNAPAGFRADVARSEIRDQCGAILQSVRTHGPAGCRILVRSPLVAKQGEPSRAGQFAKDAEQLKASMDGPDSSNETDSTRTSKKLRSSSPSVPARGGDGSLANGTARGVSPRVHIARASGVSSRDEIYSHIGLRPCTHESAWQLDARVLHTQCQCWHGLLVTKAAAVK